MTISIQQFNEFGKLHMTDKGHPGHSFGCIYAPILNDLNRRPDVSVFEIGVATGGSLALWAHRLQNPTVVALDINPATLQLTIPRTQLIIGNQDDLHLLQDIYLLHGPFDLVVDDGSHLSTDQINTFKTLWPLLDDSAYYVIEDLQHNARDLHSATSMLCDLAVDLATQPLGYQPFTITFCGNAAALQKGPTFEPKDLRPPNPLDTTPSHN